MPIKSSFDDFFVELDIEKIIFSKKPPLGIKTGRKYRQILSSIQQVGIIEPPVVTFRQKTNEYVLLDGHLRLLALNELGEKKVVCLVSKDDESYTYNKYVNRLTPIQETKMILRAIEKDVSKDKLAQTLGINIETLEGKISLVDGIEEEVVDLLKDKVATEKVFRHLKKMKPERQLEAAQLMIDLNNFSIKFAKSLLDGTPDSQLREVRKKNRIDPKLASKQARFEAENIALSTDIGKIRATYKENMLNMVSMQAYLQKLLKNEQVADYLSKYHHELFEMFNKIAYLDFLAPASAYSQ